MAEKPRKGVFINFKLQPPTSRETPNPKSQARKKSQIPSPNHLAWRGGLELDAWSFSGGWRLEVGGSSCDAFVGTVIPVGQGHENILQRRCDGADVFVALTNRNNGAN